LSIEVKSYFTLLPQVPADSNPSQPWPGSGHGASLFFDQISQNRLAPVARKGRTLLAWSVSVPLLPTIQRSWRGAICWFGRKGQEDIEGL